MKNLKLLSLLVATLAAPAIAGSGPTPQPYVPTTKAAMTWYISGAGSDTNPCTQALPCRQIKTAIDKFRNLRIRHLQTIDIAAGNYDGFSLSGLVFDPLEAGTPCCVYIYGARANATVSPGTATGTLTSVVTGNTGTGVFTEFVDSAQTWTVNAHVGKWVEILTGTGVGNFYPIESNTATGIKIPAVAAISATGATYAIRDLTSVITAPVFIPQNLASTTTFPAQGTATQAGIYIANISDQFGGSHLRIEMLRVNMTNAGVMRDLHISGSNITAQLDRLALVSVGVTPTFITGPGLTALRYVFIDKAHATTGITTSAGASVTVLNSYFRLAATSTAAFSASGGGTLSISTANRFDCDVFGTWGNPNVVSLNGLIKVPVSYNNAFRMRVLQGGAPGASTLNLSSGANLEFTGGSDILWMEGAHFANVEGNITGTCTGNILNVSRGARVRYSATSTITTNGTAPAFINEIALDSVGSTIAAMRAASPKLVTNTYGSIVFE